MSDATTADKLFPPSLPARLHWLSAGGEQTLAIRTKVDLYVKELLVKLPGLFVVCTVLSVFGSIFYLTQMARWLSLSACSPHLELSDAGIVLPQRLPGSHPLPGDITSPPHNISSCVCCCLRHHCALTGLHSSILLHESSEVIRHLTRHSMYSS